VTPVPLTPDVITQGHAIAQLEVMPKGLRINNNTNHIRFDSAWFAGVTDLEFSKTDSEFKRLNAGRVQWY
jgi:hypothetical protein